MPLFVFIIGIGLLILISYQISGQDILSPSIILNFCYLVAAISMLISWEVDYKWYTVGIIILGLCSFQFIEGFFCLHNGKKIYQEAETIDVSKIVLIVVISLQILTVVLQSREIMRIGSTGLWESVKIVRRQNMYAASLNSSQYINFYISRLMKINYAAAYVNLYIFLNNFMVTKKIRGHSIYIISVAIYIVQAFLSGGRQQFIRISLAAMIIVLLNYKIMNGWKNRFTIKMMMKAMVFLFIVILIFYNLRLFFGRKGQEEYTLWNMFSIYFSGGLYLFNTYLEYPIRNSGDLIGSRTFIDLFNQLYKYGFLSHRIVPQLEFRQIGNSLTNTYTALRYYYQDFGIKGIVIMQIIYSLILNTIYFQIKKNGARWIIPIYSFLFFSLVMHVISEQFFSILSIGFIETIVQIFIIYWIESHIAVRIGKIKIRMVNK